MQECNHCRRVGCKTMKSPGLRARNSHSLDAKELAGSCPQYVPIKRSMGTLLEELIETSPAALALLLVQMHLQIANAPEYPFFRLQSTLR